MKGNMSKKGIIEIEGVVESIAGGGWHLITTDNGNQIRAKLSGRLKNFHIKVVSGDRVRVEVSQTDPTNGRITYRIG